MRAASGAYGRRMTTHASLAALFPAAFVSAGRVTFAEAVRDHQDEVYGVALRILGDRDAAREAASAAFLKAYRSWERYDQTRPVRHWLLRIAANEAISIGRSRTVGVCGAYCSSSNISVRSTTAPGVQARFRPTSNCRSSD